MQIAKTCIVNVEPLGGIEPRTIHLSFVERLRRALKGQGASKNWCDKLDSNQRSIFYEKTALGL